MNSKRSHDESNEDDVFKKPSTSSGVSGYVSYGKEAIKSTDPSDGPRRKVRTNFSNLDAYSRHKMLINYYSLTHQGTVGQTMARDTSKDKTDFDVLRENHRFVWDDLEDEDGHEEVGLTWGQRVAKKYYDKLFKEYCIVDLSR